MRRKIVKHGSSTLTISLPSTWARDHKILAGDELEVIDEKGRLIVLPRKDTPSVSSARVNLDEWGLLGRKAISALFKNGCDIIRIDFKNPSSVEIIEQLIGEFIGFEIMQQSESFCMIKEVSSPAHSEELDEMIKRTFLLLISISEDYFRACSELKNKETLNNLIKRDQSVNKFCHFCRRIMNKKGTLKIKDLPMTYYIVEELENLGDEFKYFGAFLIEKKISVKDEQIKTILNSLINWLKDYFHLYFKFSIEGAKKFDHTGSIIKDQIKNYFTKTKNVTEIRLLDNFSRIHNIIAEMLGPLMTLKISEICSDLEVKK